MSKQKTETVLVTFEEAVALQNGHLRREWTLTRKTLWHLTRFLNTDNKDYQLPYTDDVGTTLAKIRK